MSKPSRQGAVTVSLAERRVFSNSFKPLYDEGMGLVEQAARYLDGPGRVEAGRLPAVIETLYTAESMRLTTRLMHIASWLLLQRAANSGEMTRDQVVAEKSKVRLDTVPVEEGTENWAALPETFRAIVAHSLRLQDLVRHMDEQIYGNGGGDAATQPAKRRFNPVSDQITLLTTAFGR